MKVLILAAGYGTRLQSVAKNTPKPLLDINGRPMIDYIVDKFASIKEVEEVVVVTNNKFYDHFNVWKQSQRISVPVRIVNDGTNSPEDRLGSVGDMHFVWKKEVTVADWIVIGGDNIFDFSLEGFIQSAQKMRPDVTIGLYDIGNIQAAANTYGVVQVDQNNKVILFQEKPPQPVTSLVTMCLYFFPKEMLQLVNQYIQETASADAAGGYIQWLSTKKNVYGFQFKGKWYDIGSLESLQEAKNQFFKPSIKSTSQ